MSAIKENLVFELPRIAVTDVETFLAVVPSGEKVFKGSYHLSDTSTGAVIYTVVEVISSCDDEGRPVHFEFPVIVNRIAGLEPQPREKKSESEMRAAFNEALEAIAAAGYGCAYNGMYGPVRRH